MEDVPLSSGAETAERRGRTRLPCAFLRIDSPGNGRGMELEIDR